jgi:hypothetical protein
MGKRKTRRKEDRRAFLAFLTALLAFLTSVVNMVAGALNFSTARREPATSKRHYVLKAETGHYHVITGTANMRLEPASLHAVGTVYNPTDAPEVEG